MLIRRLRYMPTHPFINPFFGRVKRFVHLFVSLWKSCGKVVHCFVHLPPPTSIYPPPLLRTKNLLRKKNQITYQKSWEIVAESPRGFGSHETSFTMSFEDFSKDCQKEACGVPLPPPRSFVLGPPTAGPEGISKWTGSEGPPQRRPTEFNKETKAPVFVLKISRAIPFSCRDVPGRATGYGESPRYQSL